VNNRAKQHSNEVPPMNDQSRTKRPPAEFRLHRPASDGRRCQVVGERQILELISLGAPLSGILNKLCMILDVRIGNVVSIVSLPDADENHFCTMTRSALQVGLEVFSSSVILSADRNVLGTLKIYGCDARRPTPLEYYLIERVTYLAALALQRHEVPADPVEPPEPRNEKPRAKSGAPLEKPPFIN
jgi:hypothetical protein